MPFNRIPCNWIQAANYQSAGNDANAFLGYLTKLKVVNHDVKAEIEVLMPPKGSKKKVVALIDFVEEPIKRGDNARISGYLLDTEAAKLSTAKIVVGGYAEFEFVIFMYDRTAASKKGEYIELLKTKATAKCEILAKSDGAAGQIPDLTVEPYSISGNSSGLTGIAGHLQRFEIGVFPPQKPGIDLVKKGIGNTNSSLKWSGA